MKKKQVLALAMAMAVAGSVGIPSVKVEAANLTETSETTSVVYGQLTEEEIETLRIFFDSDFYFQKYSDLAVIGNDYDALFDHFVRFGIFEGRACCCDFDVNAYASAYPDLLEAFESDVIKYYQHYVAFGISEHRTLTTIEACAQAGITVYSIYDFSVGITPNIIPLARAIETIDYATVAKVAQVVQSSSEPSGASEASGTSAPSAPTTDTTIIETDNTTAIVTTYDKAKAMEQAMSQFGTPTEVKLITIDSETAGAFAVLIVKGKSAGYGAYTAVISEDVLASGDLKYTPTYNTQDYDEPDDIDLNDIDLTSNTVCDNMVGIVRVDLINGFEQNGYYYEGNLVCAYGVPYEQYDCTNSKEAETNSATNEPEIEYYYYNEGLVKLFPVFDVEADGSAEYTASTLIEENEDGTIKVSVGVTNDADGFAYIKDITYTPKSTSEYDESSVVSEEEQVTEIISENVEFSEVTEEEQVTENISENVDFSEVTEEEQIIENSSENGELDDVTEE